MGDIGIFRDKRRSFSAAGKAIIITVFALSIITFKLQASSETQQQMDVKTPYYHVIGNNVDQSTFMGWKIFHLNCYACHNVDAVGSDIAPNLVERVKNMSPDTFATKVLERYRISISMEEARGESDSAIRNAIIEEMLRHERGEYGVIIMPGWDEITPGIRPHIMDIYGYLKARADGVLGVGMPGIIHE